MHLVVGLGNPGKKYSNTRHNMGFDAIDYVVQKLNLSVYKDNEFGTLYKYKKDDLLTYLLKPKTFMNNSGIAVNHFFRYFKIDIKNILIVYDDVNINLGKIKIKEKGSSGGQNGMKNIIEHLNTPNVKRVRLGIGNNPNYNLSDWVLSKFKKEEQEVKENTLEKFWNLFNYYFLENNTFVKTMSLFNN
ncbi:aminoacyl-tRNA hydrolase [Spiroplasma endosymbiont of Amphibalanus improvisus]|uniref:aminoacyl-tRNA hydrolase n=1 Tax=Spiroplasma endosymbiont of Amphibalanus improvisus TaxID=3066327 RepID=UPI00313AEFA9